MKQKNNCKSYGLSTLVLMSLIFLLNACGGGGGSTSATGGGGSGGGTANVYSVMYSFGTMPNNFYPLSLILGHDGNLYGTTDGDGSTNQPDFFQLTTKGAASQVYVFGNQTNSSVTAGSDGNFYGISATTAATPAYFIFQLTPGGVQTVLYTFDSVVDGVPTGSLIQGADGNFYGLATGGTNGTEHIYQITPSGTKTVLYSDSGSLTGKWIPAGDGNLYMANASGIVQIGLTGTVTAIVSNLNLNGAFSFIRASDGNFYGLTLNGGATGIGSVVQITPAGTETEIYSMTGKMQCEGGPSSCIGTVPVSLIQGIDGNLYGINQYGGSGGYGVIFRLTFAGVGTILYDFANGNSGNPGALVQGSDGNLYGIARGGPSAAGVAFSFTL